MKVASYRCGDQKKRVSSIAFPYNFREKRRLKFDRSISPSLVEWHDEDRKLNLPPDIPDFCIDDDNNLAPPRAMFLADRRGTNHFPEGVNKSSPHLAKPPPIPII